MGAFPTEIDSPEPTRSDSFRTRTAVVIVGLAAVAVVLQTLDLLTCVQGIQKYGLSFEANPITRELYATAGAPSLAAAKLGGVLVITYLLIRVARRGQARVAAGGLAAAALLGLIGALSNVHVPY